MSGSRHRGTDRDDLAERIWKKDRICPFSGRTNGNDQLSIADCGLRYDLLRLWPWLFRQTRSRGRYADRCDHLHFSDRDKLDLATILPVRPDGMDLAPADV